MHAGRLPLALVLLLTVTLPGQTAVIHVPSQQPTIQDGLDAADSGDTVLVADGVYTGPLNRNLKFHGEAVTLRSANGPDNCIIDCQGSDRAVWFLTNDGPGAVFEGFTIRNGYASQGGGVYCQGSAAPRIMNNVIDDCVATGIGGGIFCDPASPALISGNTVIGNVATDWGGGIYCGRARVIGNTISGNSISGGSLSYGGGIAVTDGPCEIRNNDIVGNSLNSGDCRGGGIYLHIDVEAVIQDNQIYFNLLNGPEGRGAGIYAAQDTVTDISGNRMTLNQSTAANHNGGGIYIDLRGVTAILGNRLVQNASTYQGGGIWVGDSAVAVIMDNVISDNDCGVSGGGGIFLAYVDSGTVVANNLIIGNSGEFPASGGGIACKYCSPTIINNTLAGNSAANAGGGINCYDTAEPTVSNCILWDNEAPQGAQIALASSSDMAISYSDVQGGQASVSVTGGASILWGAGNITANPEFEDGPLGEHYLSQTAAGQSVNSPCVDAGEAGSPPLAATTRTDSVVDDSAVDMGYHAPMPGLLAGPGRGYDNPPQVRVFPPAPGASAIHDFMAYGAQNYGVNVAVGDLDGDNRDEILTGAGPGAIYGPHVRGFDMDGTPLGNVNFLAYGTNKYGVNVAAGDLNGDGRDEIITGAGPGAVFGPHVRAFYVGSSIVSPVPGVSYFAYGTPKWGVNVACGDIDGDGFDEIVTGAGPGAVFGPHVRGWNFDDSTSTTAIPALSFLAYGTNKFGVNVACGDVDGDGIDEIITSPGPGAVFGTHIRGWDYDGEALVQLPGFSFFAWPASQALYGARVATVNIDEDGPADEFMVGLGPDPDVVSLVNVYKYHNPDPVWQFQFLAFPDDYRYGATVAGGRF